MTGFGRGAAATDIWHATVEVSSVNRKQAEVVLLAPRELAELEGRIRKSVLSAVSRGRIQVAINLERADNTAATIRVDAPLAAAFQQAFIRLSELVGHPLTPAATDYLRQPGILTLSSNAPDADQAWLAIEPALDQALAGLNATRLTEGLHLKADFMVRLDALRAMTATIAAEAPARVIRQRELLGRRLRDAGLDLDPADERVLKELALFADRCDITEEFTRLDAHFARFSEYLDATAAPGRALDFLCQEMFREFNTIGSKAADATIAHTIVEAKTELEKIREQVQNLE